MSTDGDGKPAAPIDVVYTWVDGDCDDFQAQLRHALRTFADSLDSYDYQPCRFRQNDELRYSLRSLERNAHWVRKIHLVTNGQHPKWLNGGSPRIQMVRHEQIFEHSSYLPTFNSNAIEMNLHRIPGLSRKFLYLNDDVFFGRPCEPQDFLRESGDVTYFERVHLQNDTHCEQAGDQACVRTLNTLAEHTGTPPLTWMPAHVPQIYDKNIIGELESAFTEEFSGTAASPFRSADDFVLRIAYAAFTAIRGNESILLPSGGTAYSFVRLTPSLWDRFRDFRTVIHNRPKFFCINDELASGVSDRLSSWMMRLFLQIYFPGRSAFEYSKKGE